MSKNILKICLAFFIFTPLCLVAKENKSIDSLARVLFIKVELDLLNKTVDKLSITKEELDFLLNYQYPKLLKTIDQDNSNLEQNKRLKDKVNVLVEKIKQNHKRYLQIIKAIKLDQMNKALELSSIKIPQKLLITFMKDDDTEATLLLIDKIDLSEDNYFQTWYYKSEASKRNKNRTYIQNTPIVLSFGMKNSLKVLDKLLTKDFLITNRQSAKKLFDLLKTYKDKRSIGKADLNRSKSIVKLLEKNHGYRSKAKDILKDISKLELIKKENR